MGIDARMLIRGVRRDTVTDEWLRQVSFDLCASIGAEHFFLHDDKGAVTPMGRWTEDGTDTVPGTLWTDDSGTDRAAEEGECLLEVHLWTRWYGVGYERGDLLTISAVAEWVEQNIPGAEVWYGGDSSGVELIRFDAPAREALKRHLYSRQGRDYYRGTTQGGHRDRIPPPPPCARCPGGVYRGNRYGWGKDYAAFSCPGCGERVQTRDGGKTWSTPPD